MKKRVIFVGDILEYPFTKFPIPAIGEASFEVYSEGDEEEYIDVDFGIKPIANIRKKDLKEIKNL